MASDEKRTKHRHPILTLVLVVCIEVALVFLFVPKETIIQIGEKERKSVQSQLGDRAAEITKYSADKWYTMAFVDSGFLNATYDVLIDRWNKDNKDVFDDRGLGTWSEKRLDSVWLALYQVCYRFALFNLWIPYVFPFLLAAAIDGILHREISKWKFSFASPAAHGSASYAVKVILFAWIVIPFAPLSTPPMVAPVLLSAAAVALWVSVANIQKRI